MARVSSLGVPSVCPQPQREKRKEKGEKRKLINKAPVEGASGGDKNYESRRSPRRRMRSAGGRGCAARCAGSGGDWCRGLSVRATPRPAAAVPAPGSARGARRAHRDPHRDRDPHPGPVTGTAPQRHRHRPPRERHRHRPPRYRPRDRRPRPPRPVPRRHRPHHDEVSVPAAGRRPAPRPPPPRSLRLQQGAPGAGGAAAADPGGVGTTGSHRECRAEPGERGAGCAPGGAGSGSPRAGCCPGEGSSARGTAPRGPGCSPGGAAAVWSHTPGPPAARGAGLTSGRGCRGVAASPRVGTGTPGAGCAPGSRRGGLLSSPGLQGAPPPAPQGHPGAGCDSPLTRHHGGEASHKHRGSRAAPIFWGTPWPPILSDPAASQAVCPVWGLSPLPQTPVALGYGGAGPPTSAGRAMVMTPGAGGPLAPQGQGHQRPRSLSPCQHQGGFLLGPLIQDGDPPGACQMTWGSYQPWGAGPFPSRTGCAGSAWLGVRVPYPGSPALVGPSPCHGHGDWRKLTAAPDRVRLSVRPSAAARHWLFARHSLKLMVGTPGLPCSGAGLEVQGVLRWGGSQPAPTALSPQTPRCGQGSG